MGTVTGETAAGPTRAQQAEPRDASPWRKPAKAMWLISLVVALFISRWVLFPRYLITFDEINFALAVDHFNPPMHQPQPPGYPVFVGLLKALSLLGLRIETVFL